MDELNYYSILGVPRDASQEDILNAYLRLSTIAASTGYYWNWIELDLSVPPIVCKAFHVLSNELSRAQYDISLNYRLRAAIQNQCSTSPSNLPSSTDQSIPMTFDDAQTPVRPPSAISPAISSNLDDSMSSMTSPEPSSSKSPTSPPSLPDSDSGGSQEIFQTIYVCNLEMGTTVKVLRSIFNRFGPVDCIFLKRPSNKKTAYAFIKFKDIQSAQKAKEEFNGSRIGKLGCTIKYAKRETLVDERRVGISNREISIWNSPPNNDIGESNTKKYSWQGVKRNSWTPGPSFVDRFDQIQISEPPKDYFDQMSIPQKHAVGMNSKGFRRQREIEEQTGAKIQFLEEQFPPLEEDVLVDLTIEGKEEDVKKARRMIEEYIGGKEIPITRSVSIPKTFFALLEDFKAKIQSETGCNLEFLTGGSSTISKDAIPVSPPSNHGDEFEVKIRGEPIQVLKAVKMIRESIGSG